MFKNKVAMTRTAATRKPRIHERSIVGGKRCVELRLQGLLQAEDKLRPCDVVLVDAGPPVWGGQTGKRVLLNAKGGDHFRCPVFIYAFLLMCTNVARSPAYTCSVPQRLSDTCLYAGWQSKDLVDGAYPEDMSALDFCAGSLTRTIQMHSPTEVVLAFDGPGCAGKWHWPHPFDPRKIRGAYETDSARERCHGTFQRGGANAQCF